MCTEAYLSQELFFCLIYFALFGPFLPPFCCRKEKNAVQLDDEGGRTFLRVLIHLIMHDYPPLLSGALHLLFKHFSQRAEVLQAFKQVWVGWVLSQETEGREPFQRLLCCLSCWLLRDSITSSEVKHQQISLALCAGVYYSSVPPEIVISGTVSIRENVGPW